MARNRKPESVPKHKVEGKQSTTLVQSGRHWGSVCSCHFIPYFKGNFSLEKEKQFFLKHSLHQPKPPSPHKFTVYFMKQRATVTEHSTVKGEATVQCRGFFLLTTGADRKGHRTGTRQTLLRQPKGDRRDQLAAVIY